ncbi:hypothetical protein [Nocardia sp. NPDC003963]
MTRLQEHGLVILVGAGLGAMTIIDTTNRQPELVDRLIYTSASACTTRPGPVADMTEPELADSALPGPAALSTGW